MEEISRIAFNDVNGTYYLILSRQVVSQSTANNNSLVKIQVSLQCSVWINATTMKLTVTDSTGLKMDVSIPNSYSSGTYILWTNGDGWELGHDDKGVLNYTFSAKITSTYLLNGTVSGKITAPNIPKQTNASQSLNSKTETTIKMNWSTTDTIDYLWYSTDNGSTWIHVHVPEGKNGTYVIDSLNSNTVYSIKTRVRKKENQLISDTSALQVTTYDYPHITKIGTPKLVIGDSQKLTLYNPLNRNVTVCMIKNNASGQQLYSGTITGTSILFTPNANTLYNSIPNSIIGDCVYSCIYETITKITSVNHYIVNEEDCKPIFNGFIYEDVADDIISLTGNNQLLVNGYSKCKITIPVSNKAVSKNGSLIVKYVVCWGNSQAVATYSSTNDVSSTVSNSSSNQLKVTVYDSRDLSTTITKTIPIIQYINPVVTGVSTQRKNGINIETYLSFKASIWNGNWSNTDDNNYANQLKYVGYRVYNGSDWTSYFDITNDAKELMSCVSNNNSSSINVPISAKLAIHANGLNGGFSTGKQYIVQVLIRDGISSTTFIPSNYQATLQGTVTDGLVGMDRYKDSDGNYHYAINGIADKDFNFNVIGKFGVNGKEIGQSNFKKLWLNPKPQSNFNSQDIILYSNDYDYLIFNYRNNESDGSSVIVKKGQNAKLTYIVYDSGLFLHERTAKYVNDTTYQFLDAKFNGGVRNWLCVPVEILGIKL